MHLKYGVFFLLVEELVDLTNECGIADGGMC